MSETSIGWCRRPRADGSLMPGYTFNQFTPQGGPTRSRLEFHARRVSVVAEPPRADAAAGPRGALEAVERAMEPLEDEAPQA